MKRCGELQADGAAFRVWRQHPGLAVPLANIKAVLASTVDAGTAQAILRQLRAIQFNIRGAADISGILAPDGRRFELEVKTPSGRQTKEQRSWQAMIELHGGAYHIARSADEAEAIIRDLLDQ